MQRKVAETEKRVDPRVQRTRERVLTATRELLSEGGLEAATVNAIATRSGVNKTTVYRNWPDPHELVHEALSSLGTPPGLPDTGHLRTDLIELFGGLAANLQRPPWDRLLPSVIGAAACDGQTREFHGALTRSRRDGARIIIERAIDRGELSPQTSNTDVIESIVGPLYYRILMTKEPVAATDLEAIVDRSLSWIASPAPDG